MKIQVTKVYEFEFNVEAEKKRIKKGFKKDWELGAKLLEMLDAFVAKEFDKCNDIYDNLPRSTEDYPGQEYVGLWWFRIWEPRTIPKITIKLEDD